MSSTLKTAKLNALIEAFSAKAPQVQIGIFNPVEAAIGAVHEFGTSKVPKRSFLREPLMEKLPGQIARMRKVDPYKLGPGKLAENIADMAKGIVLGAFETAGYGKWVSASHPLGHPLLVDTGTLKHSIEVRIEGGGGA